MQDTKPDQQRVDIGSAGHRAQAGTDLKQVQTRPADKDRGITSAQDPARLSGESIASSRPLSAQGKLPRKRSSRRISAARDQSRVRGRPNGFRSGNCFRAALRIWTPIHSEADISSRFAISFSSSASSTVNEIVTGRQGNCVLLAIA